MTREEAIRRFENMKKILSIPNSDAERTIEAIDMAIEALSAEKHQLSKETSTIKVDTSTNTPTNKPTDLISREDIALAFDKTYCEHCREEKNDHNGVKCRACWVDDALDVVDSVRSRCEVDAKLDSDLISRDELRKAFCRINDLRTLSLGKVGEIIDSVPSVSAERVGEWKRKLVHFTDGSHGYRLQCSVCGEEWLTDTPYCPNCGARMEDK